MIFLEFIYNFFLIKYLYKIERTIDNNLLIFKLKN
jgi:hypothetical protein